MNEPELWATVIVAPSYQPSSVTNIFNLSVPYTASDRQSLTDKELHELLVKKAKNQLLENLDFGTQFKPLFSPPEPTEEEKAFMQKMQRFIDQKVQEKLLADDGLCRRM